MNIRTWKERMPAECVKDMRWYFEAKSMQAEIDDLRAALAAKLMPMTDEEITDLTTDLFPCWREEIQEKFVIQVARSLEARHITKLATLQPSQPERVPQAKLEPTPYGPLLPSTSSDHIIIYEN